MFVDEVPQLTIHQWDDSKNGKWIDGEHFSSLTEEEKVTVNKFKIHFPQTKGTKYSGLIFPGDTHKALTWLCDKNVRCVAGIEAENCYAFPTRGDSLHVQGNYSIHQVAVNSEVDNLALVVSSTNRHYVSTRYADLDVSCKSMDIFYQHMGHTKATNIANYRNPAAIETILNVGQNLEKLDKGTNWKLFVILKTKRDIYHLHHMCHFVLR